MVLKVFAVYDSKMAAYMQPFFVPNNAIADRVFRNTVNDRSTEMHKYPADFTLFELGTYDDQKGTFESLSAKISFGTALEFLATPDKTTFSPSKEVTA